VNYKEEEMMIEKLDKWKELRRSLFANTEPEVELVGITCPGELVRNNSDYYFSVPEKEAILQKIEEQPAIAAATSYGKQPKNPVVLNERLIEAGHLTPLESIQFNFFISGISKLCGAQMSRHRVGQGHVSASRRYQQQKPEFVYPLLSEVVSLETAKNIYEDMSDCLKSNYFLYLRLIRDKTAKKGDVRYIIPACSATHRYYWANARALRDFFRLRLDSSAEGEIKRLAFIILDLVMKVTPSLFIDIKRKFEK